MKWPRAPPAELLLSHKTFLVIREEFEPVVKGRSQVREEKLLRQSASGGCSFETWPPKMRKKRPRKSNAETMGEQSSDEEPRPATAVLEAPLVLDPRYIDKLDMSLICKESLSASLIRVSLDKPGAAFIDNPRGKADEAAAAASGNNNHDQQQQQQSSKNASPTRLLLLGRRRPNASDSTTPKKSVQTPAGDVNSVQSTEARRLDDNNNKNKQQSAQLSPLRSLQTSRNPSTTIDPASTLSTSTLSSRKKLAWPAATNITDISGTAGTCRACGRAAQPERFHSHPPTQSLDKESSSPTLPSASRSSYSIIPVRMSSLRSARKPATAATGKGSPASTAAATPRSEHNGSSAASSITVLPESSVASTEDPKNNNVKGKPRESPATSPKSSDENGTGKPKRRPRTVTCYICGREFGTMSFPIHEPKCLEKWHRENKALPPSQRRSVPQKPDFPIDSEEWNNAAWNQSQALLIPCPKCKRTFLPDRLAIHERNCRVPNKVFHRNL